VGLQEKGLRLYEVQFLVATGMARSEVQCTLFWNSFEVGVTDSAPSVTEVVSKKLSTVKWYWKKNKFVFSLTEDEVLSKGELKIDVYDPSTKGANSYLGCALIEGDELAGFLDGEYTVQMSTSLRKDPKKEDKKLTKGTINIRGGRYGGRMETERLIDIRAAMDIPVRSQGGESLDLCYCVVYWNDDLLGKTASISNDGYPVWEVFDQRWFHSSDSQGSSLYYANSTLFIELWEGDSSDMDTTAHHFIGSGSLTGHQLEDFVESINPTVVLIPLSNARKVVITQQSGRKAKAPPPVVPLPVQGRLAIGTPGTKDKTPFDEINRSDDSLTQMLAREVDRAGVEIFERPQREKK
jgi:hypothetical protein